MLLANQGRSSLSDQALQQHYASMMANQQKAGAQGGGAGGGLGTPPMGLMSMFQGGAGGGASSGLSGATAGASGASGGGAAAGSTAGAASAGGGSAAGALFSNPFTALAAVIVGSAVHDNNKGISSYKESLLGQAGGKKLDYYGGRNDGKTHGFLGKLANQDKAGGQSLKGITDFSEFDFSNGFKNTMKSVKNVFKGKLF